MKVVGLNCSARRTGNTYDLLRHALKRLEKMMIETEMLHITDYDVKPCSKCGYECLYDKKCPIEDDYFNLVDKIKSADAIIIGSPVYAGSPPAILKAFIEATV